MLQSKADPEPLRPRTLANEAFVSTKQNQAEQQLSNGQLAYSRAKFVIENPDKAKDDAAMYLSGVESVKRTWQAIKTAKPKAKFPVDG